MNELQIFNNEDFGEIRTVTINNEPYFVGKDIASALGYKDTADAIKKHIEEDDKGVGEIPTPGGVQKMTCINESGMYALILSSKLESAKKFKHWVTSEVLPTIRKTGTYNMPTTYKEALQQLLIQVEENERLEKQNEEMKPKAIFADAVSASDSSILVRDLAKIIKQNGVSIGEKRLYKWFRENGYVCQTDTSPTQKAMNLGLFEIVVRTVDKGYGLPKETRTTKVTGKGQQYFINKFLNKEGE